MCPSTARRLHRRRGHGHILTCSETYWIAANFGGARGGPKVFAMTTWLSRSACALLALSLGCSSAIQGRLDDDVALLHDNLRWGRADSAAGQVAPEERAGFEARHSAWGER